MGPPGFPLETARQPNPYKLEILGPGGVVTKSLDVTIIEGTVTNVDI